MTFQHGASVAPATGIMFIPAPAKSVDEFMKNPEKEINAIRTPPYHGDQGFIGKNIYKMLKDGKTSYPEELVTKLI